MMRRLATGTGITTALSLILAVALATATDLDVQMAVVIGLLSTLVGLAITAFIAIEEHLDRINEARVGALPLQRLLSVPELERTTVRLVDAAAETGASHGPFMQFLVRQTLEQACSRICSIEDGVAQCEKKDELSLVSRALEHTSERVIAVAARGPDWWSRPEADVYWRAYGQAAERLDITRIFVIREENSDQMEATLKRHHDLNMKTYTVHADDVPPERIQAIVVFDDALLHRHAPREEAEEGYRIEFSDRPDDILRAQETFRVLFDLAEEWKPAGERAARADAARPREEGGFLARLIGRSRTGGTGATP